VDLLWWLRVKIEGQFCVFPASSSIQAKNRKVIKFFGELPIFSQFNSNSQISLIFPTLQDFFTLSDFLIFPNNTLKISNYIFLCPQKSQHKNPLENQLIQNRTVIFSVTTKTSPKSGDFNSSFQLSQNPQ
jgi:hypothetical protein